MRRSRAKVWTVKLTLALPAGAVVTWAVACGCALWSDELGGDWPSTGAGLRWQTEVPADWPAPRFVSKGEGFGKNVETCGGSSSQGLTIRAFVTDTGWPARAMRATVVYDEHRRYRMSGIDLRPPDRFDPETLLPTRIVPLGFALNTLLAAGVLLGVVEGVAFARLWVSRRVRRASGRCPSCGYDRRGLAADAACPECGRV